MNGTVKGTGWYGQKYISCLPWWSLRLLSGYNSPLTNGLFNSTSNLLLKVFERMNIFASDFFSSTDSFRLNGENSERKRQNLKRKLLRHWNRFTGNAFSGYGNWGSWYQWGAFNASWQYWSRMKSCLFWFFKQNQTSFIRDCYLADDRWWLPIEALFDANIVSLPVEAQLWTTSRVFTMVTIEIRKSEAKCFHLSKRAWRMAKVNKS